MDGEQRPVTLLSGGLGAGKTTLVNHLLSTGSDKGDIAVLVNDVGSVNVDADLIEHGSELSMADGGITELSNGCICCGLQDELAETVIDLAREESFEYLIVEASGISDPAPIAKRFLPPSRPSTFFSLDTIVTVVDAEQFYRAFVAGESLTTTAEGRPISELLAEQVEFCDLVVLNKCDLVSEEQQQAVESHIRSLQPAVEIIPTTESAVSPSQILNTGRFAKETAESSARWKQAFGADETDQPTHDRDDDHGHDDELGHADHDNRDANHDLTQTDHDEGHNHAEHGHDHDHGDHDHLHPPEEFGVDSFVFAADRPLHPARFHSWLRSFPESVIRAKGHCWIAGRDRYALGLSHAGQQIRIDVNGRWVATLPEHRQDAYRASRDDLSWDEQWGDRETKLVFIGAGMDNSTLTAGLQDCLLTDGEMNKQWDAFENPFPGVSSDGTPPSEQQLVVTRDPK